MSDGVRSGLPPSGTQAAGEPRRAASLPLMSWAIGCVTLAAAALLTWLIAAAVSPRPAAERGMTLRLLRHYTLIEAADILDREPGLPELRDRCRRRFGVERFTADTVDALIDLVAARKGVSREAALDVRISEATRLADARP